MYFHKPSTNPGPSYEANSPYVLAPPIWIERDARFCSDGKIKPGPATGPARTGDFLNFSHPSSDYVPFIPGVTASFKNNPWDACTFDASDVSNYRSRRNGQPWALRQVTIDSGGAQPVTEDEDPNYVRFCDEPAFPPTYYFDSGGS